MIISLIAAADRNNGIGWENGIPWLGRLPRDMKRFKELTTGHAIIMGKATYYSIGARPLPNRHNIVLSRSPDFAPSNVIVHRSLRDAVVECEARGESEIFIIGGGVVYEEAIGVANRIYLTRIDDEFDADTFFPMISDRWAKTADESFSADEKNQFPVRFLTYERTA